jgi:CBS domain-containing protein
MLVGKLMSARPYSAQPEESATEAARRMRAYAIGMLPVMSGQHLVGVLTDRDIVDRVVAAKRSPETTTVGEIMTARPVTCFEDDDAETAVERMKTFSIQRLIVLDRRDNTVRGVLSVDDLALVPETSAAAIDVLRRLARLRSVELDGIAGNAPHAP